jgi:extracellular factor (EF) 3-hydroxypalmitic acid methyl ester biosynthesis protein
MIKTTAEVDRLFLDDLGRFTNVLTHLQTHIGDQQDPGRNDSYQELVQAIRIMSRKCRLMQQRCESSDQLSAIRKYFQTRIAPWFDTSWFMARAKQKPRGYPGDFELLTGIYDGKPRSSGLGGYLDLYFLQSDLGQAVVSRMNAAREFLNHEIRNRDGDLTILNVASGPCREFFTGLTVPPRDRKVTLYCIDNDLDALQYVENQVAANGPSGLPDLKFVQYNALRMRSANGNVKRFGLADIIYSIGLLDYIPDKHLVATLRGLRESLKPGGVAYFAFKDTHGYDPYEYQWFVDWFFFQRDEKQCREILCAAGFSLADVSVVRDDTGIIMDFVARVGSPTARRSDQAVPVVSSVEAPHRPRSEAPVES